MILLLITIKRATVNIKITIIIRVTIMTIIMGMEVENHIISTKITINLSITTILLIRIEMTKVMRITLSMEA
jgi:hypothetical protein